MSAQTSAIAGANPDRVPRSARKRLRIMAFGAAASIAMSIGGLALAAPSEASGLHYYIYGYKTWKNCNDEGVYESAWLTNSTGVNWTYQCEVATNKSGTTWNLDLWEVNNY